MTLENIPISRKEVLRDLLTEYEQEMTGQEDPGEYKHLDSYWQDNDRWPYFIMFGTAIAGFALINQHTLVQKEGYNMAEFYVKKEYRHHGLGRQAATELFDRFPGHWEVRELNSNKKAAKFWSKLISDYTQDDYTEVQLDNENWKGPVQIFESSKKPE